MGIWHAHDMLWYILQQNKSLTAWLRWKRSWENTQQEGVWAHLNNGFWALCWTACWVVGGCLRSEQHKASFHPNLVEILHGLPEKLQKKKHFHLLLLWDRVWHTEINTEWCQFSSQVALNHCKKMRWVIRRAAVKPQNKNYVENWMEILYLCLFHVFIWGRPQSPHLTFSSAAIFHLSSQVEAPVDDWVTFFMYGMINSPSFHCTVALCLYPNFSTSAKHVNAFPTFWLFF